MKSAIVFWLTYFTIFCHTCILFGKDNFTNSEFSKTEDLIFYKDFNRSQEIVSARTLNTKVFMTEEGNLVYRVFSRPVHFINERGKFEDIMDDCDCCFDWQIGESYSGYVDGLFEEKNVCGQSATYIQVNETYYYRGFVEFITEVIPDTTTIDSVELNLNCIQWIISNEDHDIWSMENKPSDSDAMTVYDDAANGACYIGNYLGGTGWNSWDLGSQACQDLENLLEENWFAVGISGYYSSSASYTLLYQCGTGWIDIFEQVGIEEEYVTRPAGIFLLQNHPNPFSTKTEIRVSLDPEPFRSRESSGSEGVLGTKGQIPEIRDQMTDDRRQMSLSIYDLTGRLVKSFSLCTDHYPLTTVFTWDRKDNRGNRVPPGIYFLKLKAGKRDIVRKIIAL